VVTLHDAIVLSHPELCRKGSVRYLTRALPRAAATATRIIAPTQAAASALVARAGAEPERVRVVPFGIDHERFRPLTDRRALAAARAELGLPEKFLLFVGQREPKKNLATLVPAFFAATAAGRLPHALVLVGGAGWGGVDAALARAVRAHGLA
jgi:alpha-1,3-rhamnosyl/mannosyltransferase